MKLITLDFESYYSDDYSLSKMSTEEYVTDPRFEIIMVGLKIDNAPTYWRTGTKAQLAREFEKINLAEHALLCHHTMFDALILAVHFKIFPKMYCCTRLLAQAVLKPYLRSVSLDSCLKHLDLGIQKGTTVHSMKGRTRGSLSASEMETYAEYCMTDVEGSFAVFKHLAPQFPRSELEIIDIVLRMYIQPVFELDAALLAENLAEVRAKKEQSLQSLPSEIQKSDLMSNPKFADVLSQYGVEAPMKISPKTGLMTYAFSKTDTGWKELEDEWADDPVVSAILMARLSAKSTLEESRGERLLQIATRYKPFRVPLLYYAAHTGRLGGTEKINAQNLPRIDKSKMRFAIRAPKGYVVIAADLAQIEARITAWLAGEKDLLQAFREGRDIYSEFASVAFQVETVNKRSKEDNRRRFIGKTCILGLGFGMSAARLRATLRKDGIILSLEECERLVSVYRVSKYPKIPQLWKVLDGYIGVMSSGAGKITFGPCVLGKESIVLPSGMSLVYSRLRQIQTDKYQGWVYNFGHEVRTLWGGKLTENCCGQSTEVLTHRGWVRIIDVRESDRVWDGRGWVPHNGVIYQGVQPTTDFGGIRLTADHKVFDGTWTQAYKSSYARAVGAYARHYRLPFRDAGSTSLRRLRRQELSLGSTLRLWAEEALSWQGDYPWQREVLRLRNQNTNIQSKHYAWDVTTSCVRGLAQYVRPLPPALTPSMGELRGAGYQGMQSMARIFREFLGRHGAYIQEGTYTGAQKEQQGIFPRQLLLGHLPATVTQHPEQPACFYSARGTTAMAGSRAFGDSQHDPTRTHKARLARGANVRLTRFEPVYDILNAGPNHCFTVRGTDKRPVLAHNCVQALARIIVMDNMLTIKRRLGLLPALQAHDELVYVVPAWYAARVAAALTKLMRIPPAWALDLPIDVEVNYGQTYGDTK